MSKVVTLVFVLLVGLTIDIEGAVVSIVKLTVL